MPMPGRQLAICICVLVLATLGCNSYKRVPIRDSATINPEWQELLLNGRLRWSEPEEEIMFHVDWPRKLDEEHLNPVMPDGTRCTIEVLVGDMDGQRYRMDVHGGTPGNNIFYAMNTPLGFPDEIKSVKMRSNCTLKISRIEWVGYDPRKVKQ